MIHRYSGILSSLWTFLFLFMRTWCVRTTDQDKDSCFNFSHLSNAQNLPPPDPQSALCPQHGLWRMLTNREFDRVSYDKRSLPTCLQCLFLTGLFLSGKRERQELMEREGPSLRIHIEQVPTLPVVFVMSLWRPFHGLLKRNCLPTLLQKCFITSFFNALFSVSLP